MQVKWKSPKGKILNKKKKLAAYGPGEIITGEVIQENTKTYVIRLQTGEIIKKKKNQVEVIDETSWQN